MVSRYWPINLARPAGLLIDWRLAGLKADTAACLAVLQGAQIEAVPIPDGDQGDACGWSNGVRLTTAGGSRVSVDKISCEMAASLALWLAHEVQPRAREMLGSPVAVVRHRGGFACRNIRGNPGRAHVRSEHASANALDISGFTLQDGRHIDVRQHWTKDGPEARFLRATLQGACKLFRVAIGPDYNAAHRDHFHLDRGRLRACR